MGTSKTLAEIMMDWRTLAVIALVTIGWRTYVSIDGTIALWESVCSGVVLMIFGWGIFGYLYAMSKRDTSWLISNKLAQGLAISTGVLNLYVLIYYGMRWPRLMAGMEAYVEAYMPSDYLLRSLRYAMLVLAYCGIIWATGHLKKMHDNYMLITEDMPETRRKGAAETMFRVITDERTVIVILGVVFLWRAVISLDGQIELWESMCSGIALSMLGWVLFGYISSLAVRTTRPSVAKIYQGFAFAIFAVDIYVLVYYGMRWYTLLQLYPATEEEIMPMAYVFRDVRYFVLAIFFCVTIVFSKYLEKASGECEYLTKKEA